MPKGKIYRILGLLIDINEKNFNWYDACSICNNKVYYNVGQVICYKCHKNDVQIIQGVALTITIKDSSGSMRLILFNKQIEYLLRSTISEVKEWIEPVNEGSKLKEKCQLSLYNAYVFTKFLQVRILLYYPTKSIL
ncbi:replication protein A 70 kDa DNA-binding subunit B-like [Chenopodium quinoa]|uniref:replication protein A 70 kDa DNA-binding subunit B-like n=1 Tax=Chenopodium quinoa TaxID=63459 RepID=UPI000B772D17|nr:replication protein A 70 kDa DNA-binding subunit B-like [Chenopodium quinoa]